MENEQPHAQLVQQDGGREQCAAFSKDIHQTVLVSLLVYNMLDFILYDD